MKDMWYNIRPIRMNKEVQKLFVLFVKFVVVEIYKW
jgi:hypothetical protein